MNGGRCRYHPATAVIMSITASAPFDPEKDSDLAVAYIAVFILMFNVSRQSITLLTVYKSQTCSH